MNKFIPLSVPNLKGNELKYVSHAVQTEWVSSGGPYVTDFEHAIAKYVGTNRAVSCQNGTSGIHLALMLAGVKAGDEVIVPTLTFIAAVNPVSYVGAHPVFMDCDDSLCIDPEKLETFFREECTYARGKLINKKTNRTIKAIIIVHVFGNMADMEALVALADRYQLKVIEDATEALGTYYTQGKYKGRHAGTIGDFGIYSFNGNKIITTGGGGMLVCKRDEDATMAKHLSTQAKSDEVNFMHDMVGYNYRMTNIQAALGLAQLEQLESFIEIKNQNYVAYKERIEKIPNLSMLSFRSTVRSNKWFYSVNVKNFQYDRATLITKLHAQQIQTRPIWGLIHEQIPYKNAQAYRIEKAKEYWMWILNVPCSTNLAISDVKRVCDCFETFAKE